MASTAVAIGVPGSMQGLDGEEGLPSCGEVGWFSFLFFRWVNPLVNTGVERQIDLADTPRLAAAEDTLENTQRLLARVAAAEAAGSRHPLLRGMITAFWPELLCYETFAVASHFVDLLNPLLLQKVLVFQEAQNQGQAHTPGVAAAGFNAIGGLIALNLFSILYKKHIEFYKERIDLRIGSALRGTVLVRGVQGQPVHTSGAGGSGPTVYNVLSFDVSPLVNVIWIVLGLWLFPIQFITTLGVLCREVEGAAIPGMIVIVMAKLVVGVLLFCDGLFRHQLLLWKDRRLGSCNESFSHVRALQMLSWVGPFQERIIQSRREELRYQALRLWMSKMAAALDYSLTTIVTLATFAYFTVVTGSELKASVALPVISLISSLIGPIANFPNWLNQYLVWRSAYDRVCRFLGPGRHGPPAVVAASPSPPGTAAAAGAVAAFEGCTLSWGGGGGPGDGEGGGSDRAAGTAGNGDDAEAAEEKEPLLQAERKEAFALRDLEMQVGGGDLLVLVGQEGQGKSSVLLGLLGEMVLEAGSVRSPAIARRDSLLAAGGRQQALLPLTTHEVRRLLVDAQTSANLSRFAVAYAAQEVLLVTGTVRWNILFGARQDDTLYAEAVEACALAADLAQMPAGDLTEVAQGGANLSGGQRARIGLARAVYRAALLARSRPQGAPAPLVLLDDPLCSLDRSVAREVCSQLFAAPGGLLGRCAVVFAAADPWFLGCLPTPAVRTGPTVVVLRSGRTEAVGRAEELHALGLPELRTALGPGPEHEGGAAMAANPQDALDAPRAPPPVALPSNAGSGTAAGGPGATPGSGAEKAALVKDGGLLVAAPQEAGRVVKDESRVEGQVKCATYLAYLASVGPLMLLLIAVALTGISLFQNCCNLWIVYWTSEDRSGTKFFKWMSKFTDHPPTNPGQLLMVYAIFVVCFTLSNFAGHSLEILGGVGAARKIFNEALQGTLARAFGWWDANPTGRVLNRFSEDVEVMDAAITNILGVIFGAVLYFVSHTIVLAIANPFSLFLLPVVILVLEYYARFYRKTIREVQRIFLVSMGTVYQEMVEAITGKVTVRAFDASQQFICSSLERLDRYQRNGFTKSCVQDWVQLRMSLIGYVLGLYNTVQPALQYLGLVHSQSAALVGFSINYSKDIMAIVQQLIMNYSDLEMQLVSIERLIEYAERDTRAHAPARLPPTALGLRLADVTVRYRDELRPALAGVNLSFLPRQATAIVGRTGAGKSSLLLSVLQLVPYAGRIEVGGHSLAQFDPEDVRRHVVGVVPQQPVIFAGDLRWNLDPEGAHSDAEVLQAARLVGLQAACQGEGQGLAVELGSAGGTALSAGQRQLLCAARVLLRRPRVAMLDEVTASLPPEVAESTVLTLIGRFKEHQAAVLLVTHQEELLASCERVVTIAGGRVVADRLRGAAAGGQEVVSL